MAKLENFIAGRWQTGTDAGQPLVDPVTGEVLAHAASAGIDLAEGFAWSRRKGEALRALTFAQRAELVGRVAEVLAARKNDYYEIARRNSGSTQADSAFDIDGAIFTLKAFARAGKALGDFRLLRDGGRVGLSKDGSFDGQHYLGTRRGVAVFINAFNFPSWGLWEKAAPALIAGMPIIVKPATPTAWLTQQMVRDVVAANVLPEGSLSIVCGAARDLLDHVDENDVVSFTGSADTAQKVRTHPAVVANAVAVNVEADSVNAAILGPDAAPGTREFELLVAEVIREMTIKAGQKCTAIRRILVPAEHARATADAIAGEIAKIRVGNPANADVRMGPVVNRAQQATARERIAQLRAEADLVAGDEAAFKPIDADPAVAAFVPPTLLMCRDPAAARAVHDIEVFGPASTVLGYRDADDAIALARRGRGSLVASVFSADAQFIGTLVPGIADMHGRILVVDRTVEKSQTGHGNVMPTCLHGGPGRAGGGEELGGLRALAFYMRRFVVQGPAVRNDALAAQAADAALLAG